VQEVRSLASVIGEDELSDTDKCYLEFGSAFEKEFISQGREENRDIEKTLNLGWEILKILPRKELSRIDTKILAKYYPVGSEG
jgi:V/A-type H+-transporting ATPase subunit B